MRRTTKLLTADYDSLSLEDRIESLRVAREAASETMSDELDQDARVSKHAGKPVRLSRIDRCPNRIVDSLEQDDPRRLAYQRELRQLRAAYAADREVRS